MRTPPNFGEVDGQTTYSNAPGSTSTPNVPVGVYVVNFNIYEPGVSIVQGSANGLNDTLSITLTASLDNVTAGWLFLSDTLGPGTIPFNPLGPGAVNGSPIPSIDVTEPPAPGIEPAPAGTYLDLTSQIDTAIGVTTSTFNIQFTSVSNELYCNAPLPLPVFGTGVGTTGALLSTNPVSTMPIDPHYTLQPLTPNPTAPVTFGSLPGLIPTFTAPNVAAPYPSPPAHVLNKSDTIFNSPALYDGNSTTSEWISPDSTGYSADEPSGYYDYRTTFVLAPGLSPESVVLKGDWAVDNEGYILVNGKPVSSSSGGTITTTDRTSFQTLQPFVITDQSTGGGSGVSFQTGTNYLDFIVHNDDLPNSNIESPTGLRVDLSGTACCADPVPLPVFGTGLNTSGALLSTNPVSPMPSDPHYTLVTPVNGDTPATLPLPAPTYVINSSSGLFPPYVADGPSSEWISPDPSGYDMGSPGGYYDYETTFVMPTDCNCNPQTAVLTGNWAADNEGTIWLNGEQVMSPGATISTTTAASFDTLHYFTITDQSTGSGSGVSFKSGTNTLDFIVHNDGDTYTGLRVDLSGTVCCSSSAIFNGTDTSTQGNWVGVYGTQGYDIIDGPVSAPTYATITPAGQSTYVYSTNSSDPRALENVPNSSNNHIAADWYSASSFTVDVDVTDGNSHNLELYATDFDSERRTETIQLSDAITGTVLDTETLSNFSGGDYLIWTISGNVLITVTNTGPTNAIVNGLFFDPTTTPVSTTTGVTSSLNPSTYGQSVTFTATVSDTGGGVPSGSVAFYYGSTDLGSGSSLSGSGNSATSTFTASTLPAGSQSITAFYTPTGNFANSSGSLSQTVNPATLTITAHNGSKIYGTLETFLGTAFTETGLVTANGDTITGVTENQHRGAGVGEVGHVSHRAQRRDGQWSAQLQDLVHRRHAHGHGSAGDGPERLDSEDQDGQA